MAEAIATVDASVNQLITGINERGLSNYVNVIVVYVHYSNMHEVGCTNTLHRSDHGMTNISHSQVILLDKYISLNDVTV